MKLFTFGDSWTEGVGGDLEEEYTTDVPIERTNIRHKYAWPTQLSKLLNIEVENLGAGGSSNNAIFNAISFKLRNGFITNKDFVVIMWSSSLRDAVPFFPEINSFVFWGKRHKQKEHLFEYLKETNFYGLPIKNENIHFTRAEKNFRQYYYDNLFTDDYYDIVNQNYIIYLQYIFNELGIRYMFCDAFDSMIRGDIRDSINKVNLINENRYWGLGQKTLKDVLGALNRSDVWEDNMLWTDTTIGKHPSKNGYKIIADEMHDFIVKNNLLTPIRIDNSFLI
jgi:lysophospholipase L1-like esterase